MAKTKHTKTVEASPRPEPVSTVSQRLPDAVLACVCGGSNAIGAFYNFINDPDVKLIVCEAAGRGIDTAETAATIGTERFVKRAADLGMDGLILPDVPFEEKEEFDTVCQKYGLDLVSLIAPTSHDRIRMIAKEANGFVYCVSSLGVIVGSAIVKLCGQYGKGCVPYVAEYVKSMKNAIR